MQTPPLKEAFVSVLAICIQITCDSVLKMRTPFNAYSRHHKVDKVIICVINGLENTDTHIYE